MKRKDQKKNREHRNEKNSDSGYRNILQRYLVLPVMEKYCQPKKKSHSDQQALRLSVNSGGSSNCFYS